MAPLHGIYSEAFSGMYDVKCLSFVAMNE